MGLLWWTNFTRKCTERNGRCTDAEFSSIAALDGYHGGIRRTYALQVTAGHKSGENDQLNGGVQTVPSHAAKNSCLGVVQQQGKTVSPACAAQNGFNAVGQSVRLDAASKIDTIVTANIPLFSIQGLAGKEQLPPPRVGPKDGFRTTDNR